MIEAVIILGVIYLIFKGGSLNISAATTPVTYNSTGASLSTALGTANNPPSVYATGYPGTLAQNPPAVTLAGTSASFNVVPSGVAGQPNPPVVQPPPVAVVGTNAPNLPQPLVPTRTLSPGFHNNVVFATPVVANTRPQAPVALPAAIPVLNPATQRTVIVNPALTGGVVSTARNSPEVASPPWTPTNPKLIGGRQLY